METPKSAAQQIRSSMRNHTPRLSERKKKLFDSKQSSPEEEEDMMGIQPLSLGKTRNSAHKKTPTSTKSIEALMGSTKKTPRRVISFFEMDSDADEVETGAEEEKLSPTRRSVRLKAKKNSPSSSKSESDFSTSPHKENIPVKTPTRRQQQEEKQLEKMFTASMQITPRNKSIVIDETSSEEELEEKRNKIKKNLHKRGVKETSTGLSPMRKVAKTTVSPLDSVAISTKSFYSAGTKPSPPNNNARTSCRNLFGQALSSNNNNSSQTKHRNNTKTHSSTINRGVRHKIRKRPTINVPSRHYAPVDIDRILSNVRNEKLRKLITSKREEKQQIEKVHNIFRQASNPIAMAKPLSSLANQDDSNNNNLPEEKLTSRTCYGSMQSLASHHLDTDFSDIECDSGEEEVLDDDEAFENALRAMDEEVIPIIKYNGDDALSTKSDDAMSVSSTKRKFFKSGRQTSTKKEIKITDNIKAMVKANGRLALVQEKKKVKKRLKIRNSVASEFSDEQATVDAILRNLDDTAFGDIIIPDQDEAESTASAFLNDIDIELTLMKDEETPAALNTDTIAAPAVLPSQTPEELKPDNSEFIKRLPYKTTDPEIIQRQQLLLDFLISNDICTEENFKIFIADPDNHKDEAERIIDELVMVVTGQQYDFRHKIPYNTTNPEIIARQEKFLDFMEENNLCTEDNFDIFIGNYEQRKEEAEAIMAQYLLELVGEPQATQTHLDVVYEEEELDVANTHTNASISGNLIDKHVLQTIAQKEVSPLNVANDIPAEQTKLYPIFYPGGVCQPLSQPATKRKQPRSWNAGYGSDQYQIDAGQKEFGAHQCKQCGLVYTAHEPEEEKVHRDFHASLHVLRFKGWIDEDIMAIYPEWGPDGRIIRLTETSALKRRERLTDILKIVDKELGFASYIVPRIFVAYFAVRKMQIVGVCLVQPLNKASKYMNINGVDCCTEEQFQAKCGISRIWVSPLHRRFHIASKLIQAVQLNTIYGEEIPLDKIAFSAPTEMGKAFAQKITGCENFLVYQ